MQKFIRNLSANIIMADFILAFLILTLFPFLEGNPAFRSAADFYGYFILFPAIGIYILLQKIANRMELKSKSGKKQETSEVVIAASQILPVQSPIFSKPVQLSLGVVVGPREELFDQPKREEVRYTHPEPQILMCDGEPPAYGVAKPKAETPPKKLPPGTVTFHCYDDHCEMTVEPLRQPKPLQVLLPKKVSKPRMENLTREQKNLLEVYSRRWAASVTSPLPVDRVSAEKGIKLVYESVGIECPKIIWCGSPAAAMASIALVRRFEKNRFLSDSFLREAQKDLACLSPSQAWPRLWKDILFGVGEALETGMGAPCHEQVLAAPIDRVSTMLIEYISQDFYRHIQNNFENRLKSNLHRAMKFNNDVITGVAHAQIMFIHNRLWQAAGNLEDKNFSPSYRDLGHFEDSLTSYWVGAYGYIGEVLGFSKVLKPVRGLVEALLHCGYLFTFEKVCWVTERASFTHRDQRGYLHNDRGLAIGYPDGWGIHVRHGVAVKEDGFPYLH